MANSSADANRRITETDHTILMMYCIVCSRLFVVDTHHHIRLGLLAMEAQDMEGAAHRKSPEAYKDAAHDLTRKVCLSIHPMHASPNVSQGRQGIQIPIHSYI